MRAVNKLLIISVLIISSLLICSSQVQASNNKKDAVFEAMQDEITRSMKSLKMENMDAPYFIEYTIRDNRKLSIKACFGDLTESTSYHNRKLNVGVRVGDYQLDNSEFNDKNGFFFIMGGNANKIAIDDDYNNIRHDIWLATDKAYKHALEQMAAKNAYLKTHVQTDKIPDFSKEKVSKLILPMETMTVNRVKWERVVSKLSGIFRLFPAIHESGVELSVNVNHRYYVNSEGTLIRKPEILAVLLAYATTQADDGMKLKHYVPFFAPTIDGIPDETVLTAGIKKMAEQLTALASAPVMDEYIGPVLFTGQASAELFTQLMAPNFSGHRPPLSNMRQMSSMSSSKLAQRLNRSVLPESITIIDDPTTSLFKKIPLIGTYSNDDQGVPAEPVTLVEKGVLKTLLMSRRPRKEILKSNGHARAVEGGKAEVHISNLFIKTDQGKSLSDLKAGLIKLCKDQQVKFGLLVKTVDNPLFTGKDDSFNPFMFRSNREAQLTAPVMVYKVYVEDGREELVRGLSFGDISLKSFRDIIEVGNDYHVHHRLLTSGGATNLFFLFFDTNRIKGIPGSITAPSVLFEELELKKRLGNSNKPPLVKHPYFGK